MVLIPSSPRPHSARRRIWARKDPNLITFNMFVGTKSEGGRTDDPGGCRGGQGGLLLGGYDLAAGWGSPDVDALSAKALRAGSPQ